MGNTIKSTLGFLGGYVHRMSHTPREEESLDKVVNYLQITESMATSGQPTEEQFELIRDLGYRAVINLAPDSWMENSLKDEEIVLEDLGLEYEHIPVNFYNPKESDFQRFVSSVERFSGDKLWVHCAANMRVSAFVYRYRRDVLGEDEAVARADLSKIWEPFGPWRQFVDRVR